MNGFERLDEVRSVNRAKALESVEYFALHVLGHKAVGPHVVELWNLVVKGERVEISSEVFTWLFPELTLRRAA